MTETRPGPTPLPGHPDLDALGDFDAGILDPAASARLRAHLSGCGRCQAVLAEIGNVPALLRDLPPVRMPAEVEARIFAALDAERRTRFGPPPAGPGSRPLAPVTSLDTARPRRRRFIRPLALVAAGFALAVGGAVTTLTLQDRTRSTTSAGNSLAERSAPTAELPAAPTPQPGLPAYDRESVTQAPLLVQILTGQRGPLSQGEGGTGADSERLRGCAAGVARVVPGTDPEPAGLQHIRFEGRSAYLLLYAGGSRRILVVVAERCSAANPQVLFSRTV